MEPMANLLVLHPDKAWVDFLELALLPDDHRLIHAKVGTDALFKIKNERFNLIVALLPIPKITLSDFLHALSTDLVNFKSPVLLMLPPGQYCEIPPAQRANRIVTMALPDAAAQLREAANAALGRKTGKVVHAEFVNQILLSVKKTFKDMAGLDVVPGKPYRRDSYPREGVVGLVPISSPSFSAQIALNLSEDACREVLKTILGGELPEGRMPVDGIAEMMNVMVGSAKRPLNEKGFEIAAARPEMLMPGVPLPDFKGASIALDFAMPAIQRTFTVEIIVGAPNAVGASLTPTTQTTAAQAGSGTH